MKTSIRRKFILSMLFIFLVIATLSVLSAVYMNRLSTKTSAILKENVISVVCARDMTENALEINQELSASLLTRRKADPELIRKAIESFEMTLQTEKDNITETGEDKLVNAIETQFAEFKDAVNRTTISSINPEKIEKINLLFTQLNQQLILLSQMNAKAIEVKTEAAKTSARNSSLQMSIVATLCLLITLSFTFSFSSYFSDRVFQLYNGIKEIGANNYGQRLHFDGKDEFYEIAVIFNEMAEKLEHATDKPDKKEYPTLAVLQQDYDMDELKRVMNRLKEIETEAKQLLDRLENTDNKKI